MNSDQTQDMLEESCKNGSIYDRLKNYLSDCARPKENESSGLSDEHSNAKSDANSKRTKQKSSQKSVFPNLAGFCRYLGISTGEFEKLTYKYPLQHGRILTVLEDEALNSEMSATLLSAYLKKRIGYDSSQQNPCREEGIQISFEHDIFEDGE